MAGLHGWLLLKNPDPEGRLACPRLYMVPTEWYICCSIFLTSAKGAVQVDFPWLVMAAKPLGRQPKLGIPRFQSLSGARWVQHTVKPVEFALNHHLVLRYETQLLFFLCMNLEDQ